METKPKGRLRKTVSPPYYRDTIHTQKPGMSQSALYDLIERLGHLMRTELRAISQRHSLLPAHVDILHYLDRCNRYSDSPIGVAEYLGLTKGTVSQTLRLLERRGYLKRDVDEDDRRRQHLTLTNLARALLAEAMPPDALVEASIAFGSTRSRHLALELRDLTRITQRLSPRRSFGTCRSCRHLISEDDGFRCGAMGERLRREDTGKICREHDYPLEGVTP